MHNYLTIFYFILTLSRSKTTLKSFNEIFLYSILCTNKREKQKTETNLETGKNKEFWKLHYFIFKD